MPKRESSRWTLARVSLVLVTAPGLAFALDQVPFLDRPLAAPVVARLLLFIVGVVWLFRVAAAAGTVAATPGERALDPGAALPPVFVIGVLSLVWPPAATVGVVLLAAAVEEVVFRRQMPAVLTMLLERAGRERYARATAILASQVVFALSHFVISHHPAPFADGAPLVRLLAAGCFLAILHELSGLASVIMVHWMVNVWIGDGRFGSFVAPAAPWQLACLAIGLIGVAGAVRYANVAPLPAPARRRRAPIRQASVYAR